MRGSGESAQHPSFPRAACEQQAVAFTLQEDAAASLTLAGGPWALDFDLTKVPGPEAASRLQALTLGLAERVCSLERRLTGGVGEWAPHSLPRVPSCLCFQSWLFSPAAEETAASPRKSPRLVGPQQFLPGETYHLRLRLGLHSASL